MKSFLTTMLLATTFHCIGQTSTKQILETLSSFNDQYGQPFKANIEDSIVVIHISGLEDPATMCYDKLKDKVVSNPAKVFFVGAFDNMPGGAGKINHIKNGFISKYGRNYIKVLLDADGTLGKISGTDGLSVIVLKKGSNQPFIANYGMKRKLFFDAISKYFN